MHPLILLQNFFLLHFKPTPEALLLGQRTAESNDTRLIQDSDTIMPHGTPDSPHCYSDTY